MRQHKGGGGLLINFVSSKFNFLEKNKVIRQYLLYLIYLPIFQNISRLGSVQLGSITFQYFCQMLENSSQ